MTDLHENPTTRRSKRLERSRSGSSAAAAAAAGTPTPARRVEAPVPPRKRKRERSVPAARVARSPSPPCCKRDSEEGLTATPPRARSAEALAPPPKSDASVRTAWPRTAYVLRNRDVPDTCNREPYYAVPARYQKRKEPEQDRSRSSRKKPKQPEPWEAISCARAGLEHYNSANQGDEHELVKAVDANSFIWCGGWLHANFLARPKGANSCVDLAPKYFFAELNLNASGLSCASCVKMDSVEPKDLGHCGVCPGKIMHPAAGVYLAKDCTADDDDPAGVYLAKDSAADDDELASDDDDLEMAAFDFL